GGGDLGVDLRLVPVLHTHDDAIGKRAVELEGCAAGRARDELTLNGVAGERAAGIRWRRHERAPIELTDADARVAQRVEARGGVSLARGARLSPIITGRQAAASGSDSQAGDRAERSP